MVCTFTSGSLWPNTDVTGILSGDSGVSENGVRVLHLARSPQC